MKQQLPSAAFCVAEQIPHCSPPVGEGSRKGDPKNACFTKTWVASCRLPRHPTICSQKPARLKKLTIATWNVRTLLDIRNTNRPSRRTALVAHELSRYNIDLAALSETRISGEDSIVEEGEGYTFFWKGLPPDVPRQHGVGFAIRTFSLSHIPKTPTGIMNAL